MGDEAAIVVSYRAKPARGATRRASAPRWIVVPEPMWTRPDEVARSASAGDLPYPLTSADNRWSRRRRERLRVQRARRDHETFTGITDAARPSGSFVARPDGDRVALEVVP